MELQQHDLHHEFPEFKDAIHQLKTSNHHFAKLSDEYHAVNKQIRRIEETDEAITDEAMEALKRERLRLKDEIHGMLRSYGKKG